MSPIHYFGGKSRLATKIVGYLPPHTCYVEAFGGSASVLLAKPPSKLEVFNDLNEDVTNLFRVLRDPRQYKKLHRALNLTPVSRLEFIAAKEKTEDQAEAARRFVVLSRQSFLGKGKEWSYSKPRLNGTRNVAIEKWNTGINILPAVHERLRGVQIDCLDWRIILRRYDSPSTCFYLDPPYLIGTRVSGGYVHELTDRDHSDLIKMLLRLRGMAVLSGYRCPIHDPLEAAGWVRVDFKLRTFTSDVLARRTESLWLSPSIVINDHNHAGQPISAIQKMREGAYQTHERRVATTTRRIQTAIINLQRRGERPTKTLVAQKVGITREHLTRMYAHLFEV